MSETRDSAPATLHGGRLKQIIEAALLAAGEPLSPAQISALFTDQERPPAADISRALEQLEADCADRGVELRRVAGGYRLQVKQTLQEWIGRLWTDRPRRYSRAMLETLALIAYRQPITRGEIEEVRGVSLSSNIIRTLQEREWIRVVGHRDVPGKPALFGTTRAFLDYFDLESLDELPTLSEIKDMETLEPELALEPAAQPLAAASADPEPAAVTPDPDTRDR
jgi:segregation and condensation protein B